MPSLTQPTSHDYVMLRGKHRITPKASTLIANVIELSSDARRDVHTLVQICQKKNEPALTALSVSIWLSEWYAQFHQDYISLLPVTVVGFVQTAVTAFEHDGVAQLTVAVSVPSQTCRMEQYFSLCVNILDGNATGVWWGHFMYMCHLSVYAHTQIRYWLCAPAVHTRSYKWEGLFGCWGRGYSREAVEVVRAKQAVCIT